MVTVALPDSVSCETVHIWPAGSAEPALGCQELFCSFSTVYPFLCLYNSVPYTYLFKIIFKWISRLKETLKVTEFWNYLNHHHVLPLPHWRGFFINALQVPVQHQLEYLQFHHCIHLSGSSRHSEMAVNIFVQRKKATMHLHILIVFTPACLTSSNVSSPTETGGAE